MQLDAIAAAALAEEFDEDLRDARVQQVLAVDRLTVAFELYAGERLYLRLSADPASQGIALGSERARRGTGGTPPLAQVLRAHAVGARLRSVTWPRWERVLRFQFEGATTFDLIAELTGRMANLIVVDASGIVRGVARQVTPEMTSARVVMPGRPYQPPPPQLGKIDPEDLTTSELGALLTAAADDGRPAWRALVGGVRGVSPRVAREAVFRALGDDVAIRDGRSDDGTSGDEPSDDLAHRDEPRDVEPDALGASLRSLLFPAAGARRRPSVALRNGEPVAWAAYELTHLVAEGAEVTVCASVTGAIARYEAAVAIRDPYRAARDGVEEHLTYAQTRVQRRRDALRRQVDGIDEAALESLRQKGDLILAWQWQVTPGQLEFAAMDETGKTVDIALDPALGVVENAQRYFARYKRRKRAAAIVPRRLARAEAELATIDQLSTDLRLASTRAEIDSVYGELEHGGWLRKSTKRRPNAAASKPQPLRTESSDGFTVLVGRNSSQNEHVTFKLAARGDLWLHVRDLPGAHVVVKSAGREVPQATIEEAAALAAWFSRARDDKGVAVAITDVRHVHRMRGGGRGMVTFANASTVVVDPHPPDEDHDSG